MFLFNPSSGKAVVRRKVERNAKLVSKKGHGSRDVEQTTTRERRTEIARFGKLSESKQKLISKLVCERRASLCFLMKFVKTIAGTERCTD